MADGKQWADWIGWANATPEQLAVEAVVRTLPTGEVIPTNRRSPPGGPDLTVKDGGW